MSTTSLLDDLFTRTVGKSSQRANLPADQPSPGDILVNPLEVYSSAKSYRDPQPEITLHSDDAEPESQQDDLHHEHFNAFDFTTQDAPLPPPETTQWTYANTGLGMSTLGIFTQPSAGSSPDLRTSFGASSTFMPGVGDVFDDYGLSAFTSPPLQQHQQPASGDDSSATILPDLYSHPSSAIEIQANRRAAAAQALQKSDTPQPSFDSVELFAPTHFLDTFSFDSPQPPLQHRHQPQPQQYHPQQQQQRSAWSDPMPQTQWNANKSLRSVKSAGDLRYRSKSQEQWPSFAYPPTYVPSGPSNPSPSRHVPTHGTPRRDMGPLDVPTIATAPSLASPFIQQQPVSPSLSSHSPRPGQKKHFLDKDLTAHIASPKRAASSQGSTHGSSSSEWQQPMTPLTPRLDAALSPNLGGGMFYVPHAMPMSPSQMSMPSPSQAQLRSPLNAIEGFENVNTDFLAYDPAVYNTSPTKPRRTLNRKRSRQDLEEDDYAPPTSERGSDFEYQSESESVVSDYADSDWAPTAPQFASPQRSPTKPRATTSHTVRRVKSAPKLRQASRDISGPAPQEILQSLPSDVFTDEPPQGTSSLPKTVIQSLYQNVPSAPGERGRRYQCLIEGCGRVFPRKSAIETHIQTHLEDKPFVCPDPDCDAAFVRQHDLRRHERIHSGNKPFPCPCGKGFARGDALTRHRQRGICIGSTVPRR